MRFGVAQFAPLFLASTLDYLFLLFVYSLNAFSNYGKNDTNVFSSVRFEFSYIFLAGLKESFIF